MKTGGKLDFQGENGLPREGVNIELPDYIKKGEGGQGFEPTEAQLTAMNSGITSSGVEKLTGLSDIKSIGSNLSLNETTGELSATDTTYSNFEGATSETAGSAGLVPAPSSGDTDKYLKSDGSWGTGSSYTLPVASSDTLGGVKIGSNLSMDGNNVLSATDTTYSNFVGTDGTLVGSAGLVPAPATTDAGKFLKADGSWGEAGGGGGIATLTTADYNYPTDNPNGVALWLLDDGFYKVVKGSGVRIYLNTIDSVDSNDYRDLLMLVSNVYSSGTKTYTYIFHNLMSNQWRFSRTRANGAYATYDDDNYDYNRSYRPLFYYDIQDSLTSSSTSNPLSAKQGKALNDKIGGNLSNLTTTDKASLIAAINELVSRVSTLEGN